MRFFGLCPECGCEIGFDYVEPGDEADCPGCNIALDIVDVIGNKVYIDPKFA